jgi:DNA-binding transcriptional MerR regulator
MKLRNGAERLLIGALSGRTGVNIETIRYYERIGLLPRPQRTPGRHRLYGRNDIKVLNFIRHGRELGFSLNNIRTPYPCKCHFTMSDCEGDHRSAPNGYSRKAHASNQARQSSDDDGQQVSPRHKFVMPYP